LTSEYFTIQDLTPSTKKTELPQDQGEANNDTIVFHEKKSGLRSQALARYPQSFFLFFNRGMFISKKTIINKL